MAWASKESTRWTKSSQVYSSEIMSLLRAPRSWRGMGSHTSSQLAPASTRSSPNSTHTSGSQSLTAQPPISNSTSRLAIASSTALSLPVEKYWFTATPVCRGQPQWPSLGWWSRRGWTCPLPSRMCDLGDGSSTPILASDVSLLSIRKSWRKQVQNWRGKRSTSSRVRRLQRKSSSLSSRSSLSKKGNILSWGVTYPERRNRHPDTHITTLLTGLYIKGKIRYLTPRSMQLIRILNRRFKPIDRKFSLRRSHENCRLLLSLASPFIWRSLWSQKSHLKSLHSQVLTVTILTKCPWSPISRSPAIQTGWEGRVKTKTHEEARD